MNRMLANALAGMVLSLVGVFGAQADQVDMRNGDRYLGNVLSVTTNSVVLQSETLGRVILPRKDVVHLTIGTEARWATDVAEVLQVRSSTNSASVAAASTSTNADSDLSAMLLKLGANTNLIGQVGQQMLASSPEATAKYNELVNGLLAGQLDMDDLRRQAKSSAEQLRSLQKDLGPDATDTLGGYLQILDSFLDETTPVPTNSTPAERKP